MPLNSSKSTSNLFVCPVGDILWIFFFLFEDIFLFFPSLLLILNLTIPVQYVHLSASRLVSGLCLFPSSGKETFFRLISKPDKIRR